MHKICVDEGGPDHQKVECYQRFTITKRVYSWLFNHALTNIYVQ